MTDPQLARKAEQAGIAPEYENADRQVVEVSDETLTALLAALDAANEAAPVAGEPTPAEREPAEGEPAEREATPANGEEGTAGGEKRAVQPSSVAAGLMRRPGWGFTVQLYSLRSRRSWGHGDLADLARLAEWSASALGADFVLVNPLHAVEPVPPLSNSPYLPMTRRYVSPLYVRVEDVPEYRQLSGAQRTAIEDLAAPLRRASATPDLIDRNAVWTAKRAALEMIYQAPRSPERQAACDAYAGREGAELTAWARWCDLAEQHGPDWRQWPAGVASPQQDNSPEQDAGRQQDAGRSAGGFHAWLQWVADEQLAAAQQAAKAAGMRLGVITDLAVGVHPGGADAWSHQGLLVRGVSVGAPPDPFNPRGQDWAQPPWHPQRLAAADGQPLAELFDAVLRHAGGLRVDHVMGLMRLWWIPEGQSPDHGAYARYDHEVSVRALTQAAARAGAVAVGEDLGTVEPWVRDYLAEHGVLGTDLLWFSFEPDSEIPLRPERWRQGTMATVGSHDLPTVAGFLTGEQVSVRARLGLLTQPEEAERASARKAIGAWQQALRDQGLLTREKEQDTAAFTEALYGYLARTKAALIGVSLADAVGDTRAQNMPGTFDEYPNWRVPLCDASGQAVLLEDLPDLPLVQAVAKAAATRS